MTEETDPTPTEELSTVLTDSTPDTLLESSENDQTTKSSVQTPVPLHINDLQVLPHAELSHRYEELPIKKTAGLNKAQLIYELAKYQLSQNGVLTATGILEQGKEPFAMLRYEIYSFRPSTDDIFISPALINQHHLKTGQKITVALKRNRQPNKNLAAYALLAIEDIPIDEYTPTPNFDRLTALFPKERLVLENKSLNFASTRLIDLIAPFGKGQRGLIVAPPRGGKTVLLKQIARSIHANNPEVELMIVLLDERPEEVSDFEETIPGIPVYASTFDEPSRRHAQVADLVIERAKRRVEMGKDVVILLDSLTRLARGYNANQVGGKIMSGGLGTRALEKPRKFFGAARNVEEGGSLTIIATCLVETESRMDEIIFEEFKGTGNLEIKLDQELAEKRIFPAIHIARTATRNDDRLYDPQELPKIMALRRQLAALPVEDSLERLLNNIRVTQNNAELLISGLR